MLPAFWNEFLQFIEKSQKTIPVLHSLIKQLQPVELTEEELVLGCENHIIESYLRKNISRIEELILQHKGQLFKVNLVILEKKKAKAEPPLFQFQVNAENFFMKAGLNPHYNFDSFAVSTTNQVAYAASQAVAESPGRSYNPLFIYGGVGVGKTHLAQATARRILEKDSEKKVYFCPGDQFTNELIESIRAKTTPAFRRKYRNLNLLIIDDVQFIAGKVAIQEEFFHTFNSIVPAGGQIILTSDRPPHEIKNLEDRLRSRFSGGLIVDVQSPDFELRTAILLIKAREKNINIDIEAAKIIAETIRDSRALEGVLLSIYAKTLHLKSKIDLEAVELFFQDNIKRQVKKITSSEVVKTICSYYDIKPSQLKGPTRQENIALVRQTCMYVLRTHLKLKLEEVAYILKRKDHTTILHGVNKIGHILTKDENLRKEIDEIVQLLDTST